MITLILMIISILVAILILGFIMTVFIAFSLRDKYDGDGYCTLINDRCKHPDIECEDCIVVENHYKENK